MRAKKTSIIKKSAVRYCSTGLPKQPIPAGHFLVHNHVNPTSKPGFGGFRAWIQQGRGDLIRCRCDFGGCKNAELHEHYRVRALVPSAKKMSSAKATAVER
jgi:hypothetical protein